MEIRTPALALKGLRPGPLDDGGLFPERQDFITGIQNGQAIFLGTLHFDTLCEQCHQIHLLAVE
jgi:hypothetical protein